MIDSINNLTSLTDFYCYNEDTDNMPVQFEKSCYYSIDDFQTMMQDSVHNQSLSIMNTNARSLPKNVDDFHIYLKNLCSSNFSGFDILSFVETWMNDSLGSIVEFDNYKAVYKHKECESTTLLCTIFMFINSFIIIKFNNTF
jgi:hypothetical protein